MSCRQAAAPSTSTAAAAKNTTRRSTTSSTTEDTEDAEAIWDQIKLILCVLRGDALCSVRNDGHLSRLERLHEPARRGQVELLVARLDAEEKPVAARERESRDVEHRVIRLRQPVERQHAEYRRERRAENCAF